MSIPEDAVSKNDLENTDKYYTTYLDNKDKTCDPRQKRSGDEECIKIYVDTQDANKKYMLSIVEGHDYGVLLGGRRRKSSRKQKQRRTKSYRMKGGRRKRSRRRR
jgi:hypothetical protein